MRFNLATLVNSDRHSSRRSIVILILLWSLVQFLLFLKFGIQTQLESQKYIHAAQYLQEHGRLPETRYLFYSGIIGLIYLSNLVHGGWITVVLVQLFISLVAHIAFYKALARVSTKNSIAPLIATAILCVFYPFQQWNLALYSESLFYSSILLFFSACMAFRILPQAIFLIAVILCRPLGILFLPSWMLLVFLRSSKKVRFALSIVIIGGLALFAIISNTVLSTISDWEVLRPAQQGYIICDMPTGDSLTLDPAWKSQSPIRQLSSYIIGHPGHFIGLSLKKLEAFFLLHRSYYSSIHNLFLLLFCIILYLPLFIYKSRREKEILQLRIFGISLILVFAVAICLQCDDYHSRFINAIIPFIIFLGCFKFVDGWASSGKKRPE